MIVYHGTNKPHTLINNTKGHLYVTDTPERAQLYADAQASRVVETEPRYCNGAAVVEIETHDPVNWLQRPENHGSLDKCEAIIKNWIVRKVTLYIDQYHHDRAMIDIAYRKYVNKVDYLKSIFGDKLEIIIID